MGSTAPLSLMIQDPVTLTGTGLGQAGPLSMGVPLHLPTYSNNLRSHVVRGMIHPPCTQPHGLSSRISSKTLKATETPTTLLPS